MSRGREDESVAGRATGRVAHLDVCLSGRDRKMMAEEVHDRLVEDRVRDSASQGPIRD